MKITQTLLVLASLSVGSAALAESHHEYKDKPYFQATQSATVTAEVTAINHETRAVELLRADGEVIKLTVKKEARNLDQVAVGDIVVAQYVETMSVRVMENEGHEPGNLGVTTVERTEKGEMPGMAAVDTEIVTATVDAIDIEANTFKLKFSGGEVEEFAARNPENLKRADVGDLVVMTFSHAVAISVEPGTRD